MKSWLFLLFVIAFLFISCEKTPVLTVKVDSSFSGSLSLKTCINGAKEPVLIDQYGNGETSACPMGDLDILVIKGSKTIRIPKKDIRIDRTGDGQPVGIAVAVAG